MDSSIKSPVSLVHEIALKRNLSVVFNVVSEKGPPHMKTFITECKVGELKTEGEGNGKKVWCWFLIFKKDTNKKKIYLGIEKAGS